MSNLPDIDTTTTSWIAYWNAIDNGGVQEISPEDALSDGSLQSYTLYDNGWEGQYDAGHRIFTVRVKTDGWIVAYMDRSESYGSDVAKTDANGPHDVIDGWFGGLDQNALERAISSLNNELSAATTYSYTDVGLYNYQYTSQNATVLRASVEVNNAYGSASGESGFLPTNLTLQKATLTGTCSDQRGSSGVTWDSDSSKNETVATSNGQGALDITPDVDAMDSEYLSSYFTNPDYGGNLNYNPYGHADVCVLLLWDSN